MLTAESKLVDQNCRCGWIKPWTIKVGLAGEIQLLLNSAIHAIGAWGTRDGDFNAGSLRILRTGEGRAFIERCSVEEILDGLMHGWVDDGMPQAFRVT